MQTKQKNHLSATVHKKMTKVLKAHIAIHVGGIDSQREDKPDTKVKGRSSGEFSMLASFPIFVAPLHHLALVGAAELKPSGLLLLGRIGGQKHAIVEVGDVMKARPAIRMLSGPIVKDFERAIARLQQRANGSDEVLYLLRVPALHLYAVGSGITSGGSAKTYIPFAANVAGFKPMLARSGKSFEAQLRKAATQCILRWYRDNYGKPNMEAHGKTVAHGSAR